LDLVRCRWGLFIVAVIAIIAVTGAAVFYGQAVMLQESAGKSAADADMERQLLAMQGNVTRILYAMDADVTGAASELSTTGLTGAPAQAILANLTKTTPYGIDCITVNRNGTILAVEPREYAGVTGEDISGQAHFRRLMSGKVPVMSDLLPTVEGIQAVDIASPVFSPDGIWTGATTMLIDPGALLDAVATPVINGTSYTVWAMQTDGRIIYDQDPVQVGKNLLSDPFYAPYPELQDLGSQMVREESGSGSYTFIDDLTRETVRKEVFWTTAGIRGTEWRLVIVRAVPVQAGIAACCV
jgi:hypothetical protein